MLNTELCTSWSEYRDCTILSGYSRVVGSWGLVSFVGLARQLSVPRVATVTREVLYDTMYYDPRYQDPTGYAGGPAQMQRGPQHSEI